MIIHKYSVPIMNTQFSLHLPRDAMILCFQLQAGLPYLWVLIPDEAFNAYESPVKRNFLVRGTGQPFPPILNRALFSYIGTIQEREFVWHLFELGEERGC